MKTPRLRNMTGQVPSIKPKANRPYSNTYHNKWLIRALVVEGFMVQLIKVYIRDDWNRQKIIIIFRSGRNIGVNEIKILMQKIFLLHRNWQMRVEIPSQYPAYFSGKYPYHKDLGVSRIKTHWKVSNAIRCFMLAGKLFTIWSFDFFAFRHCSQRLLNRRCLILLMFLSINHDILKFNLIEKIITNFISFAEELVFAVLV